MRTPVGGVHRRTGIDGLMPNLMPNLMPSLMGHDP